MKSALFRLSILCASICLPAIVSSAPLLQEGKKTLYQRVLTTPTCQLFTSPTAATGKAQPAFTRYYVYERQTSNGQDWLKVGPDQFNKTVGWINQGCTVEWKAQMALAFTNPAGRDRVIFFEERKPLEAIVDAIDPVEKMAPLRKKLSDNGKADGVVALEPEVFVDMAQNFYLLPILGGEEVMTEQGFRLRLLNVASVSKSNATSASAPASALAAGAPAASAQAPANARQMKEFSAAVVFVIDSTISMDPYIDRTREAVRKVYEQIEKDNLGDQVKFGLVAFRSNVDAAPGLEYVSKVYADPNTVSGGQDFLQKVSELSAAKVSSKLFDEDAYSGVMQAIDSINWRNFGARYVILITDAGAIDGENALSGTGLSASQVRLEAAKSGIALYTLHLKTSAGVKNHAHAQSQYTDLSTFGGTNTSLYYPVNAGDVGVFGRTVDSLAQALSQQVKAVYMGDDAIGSAVYASEAPKEPKTPTNAQEKLLQDTALVGHAMQLAYLGKATSASVPPVFEAWISDRDLIKQNQPTTDVRVLLTKSQLSDLAVVMKQLMDAANEGLIAPADMFQQLRTVAAAMGADPNQLKQSSKKLGEIGLFAEFLEDLPYRSEVLNLDEDTWKSWDGLQQEKFIRSLNVKLRHYQVYNADNERWISLAQGSDPRDHVYPVPLEMMP